MQCHKPGHRAPARCVSALLAAGALLATVADHLGGPASRPEVRAALEVPAALSAPSISALIAGVNERPAAFALSRTPATPVPAGLQAAVAPSGPTSAMADSPSPQTRKFRPARAARRAAKPPARHSSSSESRPTSRHSRPASERHTKGNLLAHLPTAKNKKAAAAVREALSLLGVPYRWGGTTRAGFDCSGFTQHVWAVAGVKIPRTVRAQARAGTQISLGKAEPGDLVVFYPTQHHIGIYVGNGVVLDSPHSGSSVRPDPVRSMPVSVVVRVQA